jgi:hypothetical protein
MYPFCRKRHNSLVNSRKWIWRMFAQSKSHARFCNNWIHNSILNFNLYFWTMLDKLKSHIAQNFPFRK